MILICREFEFLNRMSLLTQLRPWDQMTKLIIPTFFTIKSMDNI